MIITYNSIPYDIGLGATFSGANEKIEASIRTASGLKFSQTWLVTLPTREYNHPRMTLENLGNLQDVHSLAGTTGELSIEDDSEATFQATFSEKKLGWTYLEENSVDGVWTSIFNVSFKIELI